MKKIILTMMLLSTACASGQKSELTGEFGRTATDPAKHFMTKILTNAEFDAYLAKPDQILLIDFRAPNEILKSGGFPIFMEVQPSENIADYIAWIPKGRAIITTSSGPVRGGKAGDILAAHGFKVLGTIGATYYEAAGGTLTKFPPFPYKNADGGASNSK